jgi:hypothetical protein
MNKYHAVTIFIAVIVVLLMLLFPPYDYPNPINKVPNFNGFLPVFGDHPNRVINTGFLSIEIFTALISSAIAWMPGERARPHHRLSLQDLVLLGVVLTLLLAVLYPPFQDLYTASTALLPMFDDFYFVFEDNSRRVIVVAVLWFEITLIVVTGAMLWLLLRKSAALDHGGQ